MDCTGTEPVTEANDSFSDSHGEIWVLFAFQLNRWQLRLERGKAFDASGVSELHLRKNRVPWDLQRLRLGHANRDATDRYAEQLKEDVEWRKKSQRALAWGSSCRVLKVQLGYLGYQAERK